MRRLILAPTFAVPLTLHAQPDTTTFAPYQEGGWSLEAGGGYGRHTFADLGIAYATDGSDGHPPLERAAYLAGEFYLAR